MTPWRSDPCAEATAALLWGLAAAPPFPFLRKVPRVYQSLQANRPGQRAGGEASIRRSPGPGRSHGERRHQARLVHRNGEGAPGSPQEGRHLRPLGGRVLHPHLEARWRLLFHSPGVGQEQGGGGVQETCVRSQDPHREARPQRLVQERLLSLPPEPRFRGYLPWVPHRRCDLRLGLRTGMSWS